MKKVFQHAIVLSLITAAAMAAGVSLLGSLIIGASLLCIANFLPKSKLLDRAAILGIAPVQGNATIRAAQSGVATDVSTGQTKALVSPDQSIEIDQEFEIVVTNTHESTPVTNVVVIPYDHDSTAATAVTNITITSSAGSRANTMMFLQNKRLVISEWHMQVTSGSAESMYAQKLEVAEFQINGSDKTSYIPLSKYRQSNGGEILDTADIYDRPLVVDGWKRLRISTMPANTQLTIRVRIAARELPQMKSNA